MRAVMKKLVLAVLSIGALAFAGEALACKTGCSPPPPAHPPHNPPPPSCGGGCGGGGGHHGGGDINVNVNVKNSSSSSSRASAFASGSGSGAVYGGGYGNWSQTPGYPQGVGLNVETGQAAAQFESYSEEQTFTKTTIIQASCIDDTGVPHPASQLFPDRNINNDYSGEIYRCIAGTHMQWVYADYNGRDINFDGGKSTSCQKGEALWFEHGLLTCRVQHPERQCNERSLLRRFGVGVKILTLTRTETVSRQRQVAVQQQSSGSSYMVFDGGVGGFVQ